MSMDETYLQVLNEQGRRADQKSFLIGQSREGPPGKNIILFHYEPSRASVIISNYLKGFNGSLLTDGLAVYQSYSGANQLSHGGCWSHARRPFADAFKAKKNKAGVAKTILDLIAKLFSVEKEIKNIKSEEKLAVRLQKSKVILNEIKELYLEKLYKIPAKSLTGKGRQYLHNQWQYLSRFVDDPNLAIHNNYIERKIKHIATGRKSWMFCTSVEGAHASAAMFSILMTAEENGLNPYDYLSLILSSPPSTPIEDLLPLK